MKKIYAIAFAGMLCLSACATFALVIGDARCVAVAPDLNDRNSLNINIKKGKTA